LISKGELLETLDAALWPSVELSSTDGSLVNLRKLHGTSVVYVYPRTSPPDGKPIEGWDEIPGARGCTPQSCAFRDHHDELRTAGADRVFGLSAQSSSYQQEMTERLHLPFAVLSDSGLKLKRQLQLPTFKAGGMELYERITMVVRDGLVDRVFYPVEEPVENASDVLRCLRQWTRSA